MTLRKIKEIENEMNNQISLLQESKKDIAIQAQFRRLTLINSLRWVLNMDALTLDNLLFQELKKMSELN